MTRLRRKADRDRIFFLTTNLALDQKHLSPDERDAILNSFEIFHAKGAFLLFGYVVMSNHMHMLLSPQNQSLFPIMSEFKSASANQILASRKSRGPLWQPRYFDNIIRNVQSFWEKLEYIHNNPVKTGLVARGEDWRWSSRNAYVPGGNAPIPVDPIEMPTESKTPLWPQRWQR